MTGNCVVLQDLLICYNYCVLYIFSLNSYELKLNYVYIFKRYCQTSPITTGAPSWGGGGGGGGGREQPPLGFDSKILHSQINFKIAHPMNLSDQCVK